MEKKIYFETKEQKVAAGLVLPILAGGFYVLRDDRDRPRAHQGLPIEQPHDHHERAPIEVTTRLITIDSGNTASVNTFNSGFFESWKSGEDEWPMMLRPNLYITVAPAARVEGSDHQTPQQEDRNEG